MLQKIICDSDITANLANKLSDWLKSLRPQPKQEWSEEDKYPFNTILHYLNLRSEIYKKEGNNVEYDRWQGLYNWLKSLKPNHWKPSEQELAAIRTAISIMEERNFPLQLAHVKDVYAQLEKL